jgi:hypothetical protein
MYLPVLTPKLEHYIKFLLTSPFKSGLQLTPIRMRFSLKYLNIHKQLNNYIFRQKFRIVT